MPICRGQLSLICSEQGGSGSLLKSPAEPGIANIQFHRAANVALFLAPQASSCGFIRDRQVFEIADYLRRFQHLIQLLAGQLGANGIDNVEVVGYRAALPETSAVSPALELPCKNPQGFIRAGWRLRRATGEITAGASPGRSSTYCVIWISGFSGFVGFAWVNFPRRTPAAACRHILPDRSAGAK